MSLLFRSIKSFKICCRNVLRFVMDSDSEYDMLDLLAYNCNQLTVQLRKTNYADEQEKIIQEHLKKVDKEFKPINEIQEDLDWFNVSEALTLRRELSGKVVVLDFFTYCCINCMHILPDLKKLEDRFTIEDGLVVIGVHSAKFDNEKDSGNILSAIQRYNITHPVVNDSTSSLWMDLHIKCWPTLLVLGPRGNPIYVLMGEGHGQRLEKYIKNALQFYQEKGELKTHAIPISPASELLKTSMLKFPAKVATRQLRTAQNDDDGKKLIGSELYAVADSGNHRVLVFQANGQIIEKIGGKESGFADGNFMEARFNSPQGVSFYGNDIIYVADTENHAIREINLTTKTVDTIAGHGKQGVDQTGGLIGTSQEISSPWDVVTFRTRDMDMSFHADGEAIPERDIILIAMAGTHQIWAVFKDETIWWKFKKFSEGSVAAIAGNGHEENRNNSYPQNAAFAQPSGLALAAETKELFIADSESSSIRKLSLADGKVLAVAGGDRNPLNLFAFGDADGTGLNAKFQHPLGVAYDAKTHSVYVADTYNHKIKVIDLATNKATTCKFKDSKGNAAQFNEPAGLCLSPCGNRLFICNTNNHTIDIVDLSTSTLQPLSLFFDEVKAQNQLSTLTTSKLLVHSSGAKISLEFVLTTKSGAKFTDGPQKWQLDTSNVRWQASSASSGTLTLKSNEAAETKSGGAGNETLRTGVATIELAAPNSTEGNTIGNQSVIIIFKLSLCADNKGICFPKNFKVSVPIEYSVDGTKEINKKTKVTIDEQSTELA